jgi:hypothetical protein
LVAHDGLEPSSPVSKAGVLPIRRESNRKLVLVH